MTGVSSVRSGHDISVEDTGSLHFARQAISILNTLFFVDRDLKRDIIRRILRVTKNAPLGKKRDRRTKRGSTMTVQQLWDLYQPQGCDVHRNDKELLIKRKNRIRKLQQFLKTYRMYHSRLC